MRPETPGREGYRLGASSVRHRLAIFREGDPLVAAAGHLIHGYVDRETRRPVPLPAPLRAALETLVVDGGE